MKLDTTKVLQLSTSCAVVPGNIYPAKDGRKPGTDYWLVVAEYKQCVDADRRRALDELAAQAQELNMGY